jgi:hypothetical protein
MSAVSVVDRATTHDVLALAGVASPSNSRRLMRCLLSGHHDSTPSFRLFERGWRCFGCGRHGGVLDLAIELGLARDRASAARLLEEYLR